MCPLFFVFSTALTFISSEYYCFTVGKPGDYDLIEINLRPYLLE